MEKGNGDQKDTMNADQKNAMDMASGSSEAVVNSSVKVMSSCKGGMAAVEKIAEPAMAKGMTHKVRLHRKYCRMDSNPRSFRSWLEAMLDSSSARALSWQPQETWLNSPSCP